MQENESKMFHDTISYEGNYIWIKPFIDYFNLDPKWQYKKIKGDIILGDLVQKKKNLDKMDDQPVAKMQPVASRSEGNLLNSEPDLGYIDANGRILLTKIGFNRWIQIINPNTIDVALRDKFILFTKMLINYLNANQVKSDDTRMLFSEISELKKQRNELDRSIRQKERIWSKDYVGDIDQQELEFNQ